MYSVKSFSKKSRDTLKTSKRAWEMARVVSTWYGEVRIPSTHMTARCTGTCNPNCRGQETGEPEACRPANLPESVSSSFREQYCLKRIKWTAVKKDSGHYHLTTCAWAHVHTHTQTYKHQTHLSLLCLPMKDFRNNFVSRSGASG